MRSHIEDVLDVLREIRSVDSEGRAGRSVGDVRLQAVQKVAKAEFDKGRYKNWDSAEKTIHEACTRRLQENLSAKGFDALVKNWLSGQPEGLQSLLKKHMAMARIWWRQRRCCALVPGEHSVVPDGEAPTISLRQFSKQTTSSMQRIPSDGKRSCRESFGIQKRHERSSYAIKTNVRSAKLLFLGGAA
jgi:hypothetical protein